MELSEALTRAHRALEADPHGILSVGHRNEIKRALVPDGDEHVGLLRRVMLNDLCVRRVLPLWYAAYPDDRRPERMLELARQLSRGQIESRAALSEEGRFWVDAVDNWEYDPETEDAVGVALASCNSVVQAAVTSIDEAAPAGDEDDEAHDPYTEDPAYSCASSAAGGSNDQLEHSDAGKRRAFWTWYLDEAVPAAAELR